MIKLWYLTVAVIMLLTPVVFAVAIGWLFEKFGWNQVAGFWVGFLVAGAAIYTIVNQLAPMRSQ